MLREHWDLGEKKQLEDVDIYASELYSMYISLSINFPVVRNFLVVGRHTCRLVASSDVMLIFITVSNSFSRFTSDRPRCRLHYGDQVIIRLGYLLSSMRNACPYHIYIFTWNMQYACRK